MRQIRAGLADGAVIDAERQIALGQTLWYLLGGGRPLRIHLVPPKAIQLVITKAGGRCQLCGGVATTVDHIATACNRPINLRAVCSVCTTCRQFGDSSVLAQAGAVALREELSKRIEAEKPLRCCDDAANWDWRAFLKQREVGR